MIALALLCAALVGLIIYLLRHQNDERKDWSNERQLLITRIQHPEIVVSPPEKARPDEDFLTQGPPDDLDLVGTVQNGD